MMSKLAHFTACQVMEDLEEDHIRVQDEVWFRVFDRIEERTQEAIDQERARWMTPSEN
jgi:hypothetical protein